MPKVPKQRSLSQRSLYRSLSQRRSQSQRDSDREQSQLVREVLTRRVPVVILERLNAETIDRLLIRSSRSQRDSDCDQGQSVQEEVLDRRVPVVIVERLNAETIDRLLARRITESSQRTTTIPMIPEMIQPRQDIQLPPETPSIMPPSQRPRRRHAEVPHRVTYKKAIFANRNIESVTMHTLGSMRNICEWCDALFFERESTNRQHQRRACCTLGEVVLPPIQRCPDRLKRYLTEDDARAVQFRRNIRAINSLFAMASFKTSLPDDRVPGQGHWCFQVCGQIYHYTEALPATQEMERPVLNQYYFVDAAQAIDRRVEFLAERLDRNVIEDIEIMLREVNPWVTAYQTMREVIDDRRREGVEVDDMVLAFRENMQRELRNYSLPESRSDIAALFCGEEPPFDVDLRIYPRNRRDVSRELKNLNRLADPMVYPLLFPTGEYGYDMALKYRTRRTKTVSIREFYRYRLQVRPGFSVLHNGDKLFQQYIVDAWCKAEASELWWLRQNQEKLRVAGKQAIERMLQARAAEQHLRVGNIVLLPTAFAGGPRAQRRKYLDAMTIVSRLGKPDLFITMTCNPRWPEIYDNLQYAQQWQHRPDLIARVFREKLLEFMDDINNKQIYGVVLYSMYVIEFQKRGLPHAHILVALRPEDKLDTEDLIDAVVTATIPYEETEPTLHSIVKESYVHRMCGTENPSAPCMRDGTCSKGYPKAFIERTVFSTEHLGQPIYKRPQDGRVIMVDGAVIDNRRIVPYNRYAAMKYRCHINFEICGSLNSIKYLHKYVHKGSDFVTVQMTAQAGVLNWDEIQTYLDCRYVSAMEAAWRLFEYRMSDRTHSVLALPVHLPDEQYVYYEEEGDVQQIAQALNKPTKLMAYFQLNMSDADARRFRYVDIPEHYTWEDKEACWKRRRQVSKMFGCLVEVSPQQQETFYLRLLLLHVRGATSFQDLKTVRGVVYDSFREACMAMGLLSNAEEYSRCLQDALLYRTPFAFRKLFALLITVAAVDIVHQIPTLWERYRAELIRDFTERGLREEVAQARALQHIRDVLMRNGDFTLESVGLPRLDTALLTDVTIQQDEHTHRYDNFQGSVRNLNQDQRRIYDAVIDALTASTPVTHARMFYVDAPGGTGKTYLFNTLIKEVRRVYEGNTIAVAWTGIAASLLIGGKTAHRTFKLPLNLNAQSRAGFPVETQQSQNIRDTRLIIWDEASMALKHAVEAVDRYLRDLMGVDIPMGGKVVIFGGDFRQVLPVVPRAHRAQIINSTLKMSYLWPFMIHFTLHKNLRAGARERVFADWLLLMGNGRLPCVTINTNDPSVPTDLIEIPPRNVVPSRESLLNAVFGARFTDSAADIAVLCPTNASVSEINRHVLDALPGDVVTYFSVDEYENEDTDDLYVPIDYINAVQIASLPPHELHLKVGAIVMLLRNIDIDMGQCNGSRLRVLSLREHLIELELLTGTHKGDKILLPKIKMKATDVSLPKPLTRFQFPITLAYAMTINKSQGQTFKKVGIYLDKPCFSHGQLYVAFSRVGSPENVFVYVENTARQGSFKFRGRKFTRNVVFDTIVGTVDDATLVSRDDEFEDATSEQDSDSVLSAWNIEDILDMTSSEYDRNMNGNGVRSPGYDVVPFVDGDVRSQYEEGAERLIVPQFSTQELAQRVAEGDRPGTTGAYLVRKGDASRRRSTSSSSSE